MKWECDRCQTMEKELAKWKEVEELAAAEAYADAYAEFIADQQRYWAKK